MPWRHGGQRSAVKRDAVVVGIGPAEDLRPAVDRRRAEPHMGVVGDQRIAVLVHAVEVQGRRVRFVLPIGAPEYLCRPITCS